MKTIAYKYLNKKWLIQFVLPAVLLLLVTLVSYIISTNGEKIGFIVLAGIFGTGLAIYSFVNPYFGFYATTIICFVIFFFERLLTDGNGGSGVVIDSFLCISALGIIFQKYLRRDAFWQNKWHIVSFLFIIFFFFILLETLNPETKSIEGNIAYIRQLLRQLLVYYIALNLMSSYRSIINYFKLWMVLIVLAALYGCTQQWFGFLPFERRWLNSNAGLLQLYHLANGDYRKFSTFTDPMSFGVACSFSALFFLVMLLNTRNKVMIVLYFLSAVILLLGMSYSGTRTATFMFIVGALLYIVLTIQNQRTLIFAGIGAFMFIFLLFAPIYGNVTLNRFRSTFDSRNASVNVRDVNRHHIQPYIYSHPFGGGLSVIGNNGVNYNPNHAIAGFPPDSGLLKFVLETGWVGYLIMFIIYFAIMQTGIMAYFRTNIALERKLLLALMVAVFANIVAQYSQVAIDQAPGCFFFYAAVASIVRLSQMSAITS